MTEDNALSYVGPASSPDSSELATLGYVSSLLSQNMTQEAVNSQINSALSSYATKNEVDEQAQTLGTMDSVYQEAVNAAQLSQIGNVQGTYPVALQSWLQQQVTYTSIAQSPAGAYPPDLVTWAKEQVKATPGNPVSIPNLPGIVGLVADSRGNPVIPMSLLDETLLDKQQFPLGVTVASPAEQNSSVVTAAATPTLVYGPVPLANIPTEPFYLLVWGTIDAYPDGDGVFPTVEVTVGTSATSGTVIGTGAGVAESYIGGVMTQYPQDGQLSGSYTTPDWTNQLDIVVCGGGAAGEWGYFGPGVGGLGGEWLATTLTLPGLSPGEVFDFQIGAGGTPVQEGSFQLMGGPGGETTVTSGSGDPIISVAGGTCQSLFPNTLTSVGQNGQPPVSCPGNSNCAAVRQQNPATMPVLPFVYQGNDYYGAIDPATGTSGIQETYAPQGTAGSAGFAPGGGGEGGGNAAPGGAGAPGGVWFFARPANSQSSGAINIIPVSPANTGPITPASNLGIYLTVTSTQISSVEANLGNNDSASVTVSQVNTGTLSNLYVWAIPAASQNVG